MPDKSIKIFLASSAELKEDREEFRTFISEQNDLLSDKGIYLKIVQWENFIDAISTTRLQDEYNKAMRESDIALCLFFTKVGKYTAEEFDTAYQVFKDTGKPKIWTYFKDAPVTMGAITEEGVNSLFAFKKKIGDMGHFYTGYSNIDNLIRKFRDQLDKTLPQILQEDRAAAPHSSSTHATPQEAPVKNTFNEYLTRQLIEVIQPYSPTARKLLEDVGTTPDWETQTLYSDRAKEIIAFKYMGVIGIQLRKLFSIGKQNWSANKAKNYLENCSLVSKRALQLLCFTLISKLWDCKKTMDISLSPEQAKSCRKFFNNQFPSDINSFVALLKNLVEVFTANNLEFPLAEIAGLKTHLETGSDFIEACNKLHLLSPLLNGSSPLTEADCSAAEHNVATFLQTLGFLANYKMESIKSIDYYEMRNSKPYYVHNYTALGVDSKAAVNQDKVKYSETPVNTDAVLIYQGKQPLNLNLFPFVIDANAWTNDSGNSGAKICFYECLKDADSLNYSFLEGNSIVNIRNQKIYKPGSNISELLQAEKCKDMRFDNVYNLFCEAKTAIVGIEEEVEEE